MRTTKFARFLLVLCLLAGQMASLTPPSWAQSGRKPQPKPAGPKYEPQDASGKPINPSDDKSSDKQSSDKPLADTTPVNVSDDGTIKLDTAMVTIPVSVLDRDNRFVPDLHKRDFQLFEDGVEQQIESFEEVSAPFNVVLVLDTSASTRFKLEDIQDAAFAFVRQLRRDDRVMVVSFDDKVYVECEFTDDRETLRSAIYQTRTGGNTKLYDAMDLVLTDALGQIQGRKAVVVFTDGVDTSSKYGTAKSTLELAEESGALAYPIHYDTEIDNPRGGNPGGQGTPPINLPWPMPRGRRRWPLSPVTPWINFQFPGQWPQGRVPLPGQGGYQRGRQYLEDLATRSGGRFYHADSLGHITDAFAKIAEELRHQYALSYYPTNANRDGSFRRVKVQIKRNSGLGMIVRARDGYRAGSDTQAPTDNNNGRKRPELRRRQWAGAN